MSRDPHAEPTRPPLNEDALDPDPIEQFRSWMETALSADLPEPTAAMLATADRKARVSARMVLIKGYDQDGFVFYTNYQSRKAQELEENPFAVLVCYWAPLLRQIVIRGSVSRVPTEESEAYFATRDRGSQLGAWASDQSRVLAGREVLERRMAELEQLYEGKEIPRPPHWGGFRLVPETIEFWQGRLNRLHDRLVYKRQADGPWSIERLAP